MMVLDFLVHLYFELPFLSVFSLCSRRLEVVCERENRRARGRHARVSPRRVSRSRAPVFFLCPLLPSACYAG